MSTRMSAGGGARQVPPSHEEVGRTSASQAEVQEVEEVTTQCLHLELEILGSGSNATYRRCLGCHGVIVSYGGRLWLLSLRLRPDEAAGEDESETDRTGAEEGRYRSTQAKEVKAVAFRTYALLVAMALTIRVIVGWAALF